MGYTWKIIEALANDFGDTEVVSNVVSNDNGNVLLVATRSGTVHISTDSGTNWTKELFKSEGKEILPNCVNCSFDGKYIVVGLAGVTSDSNDSIVYLSDNFGDKDSFKQVIKFNDSNYSIKNVIITSRDNDNYHTCINILLTDKTSNTNVKSKVYQSINDGLSFYDTKNLYNLYSISSAKNSPYIYGVGIEDFATGAGKIIMSSLYGIGDDSWAETYIDVNIDEIGYVDLTGYNFLINHKIFGCYCATDDAHEPVDEEFLKKIYNNSDVKTDLTGKAINNEGNYLLAKCDYDDNLYYSKDSNVTWSITNELYDAGDFFAYNGSGNQIIGIFRGLDGDITAQIGIFS